MPTPLEINTKSKELLISSQKKLSDWETKFKNSNESKKYEELSSIIQEMEEKNAVLIREQEVIRRDRSRLFRTKKEHNLEFQNKKNFNQAAENLAQLKQLRKKMSGYEKEPGYKAWKAQKLKADQSAKKAKATKQARIKLKNLYENANKIEGELKATRGEINTLFEQLHSTESAAEMKDEIAGQLYKEIRTLQNKEKMLRDSLVTIKKEAAPMRSWSVIPDKQGKNANDAYKTADKTIDLLKFSLDRYPKRLHKYEEQRVKELGQGHVKKKTEKDLVITEGRTTVATPEDALNTFARHISNLAGQVHRKKDTQGSIPRLATALEKFQTRYESELSIDQKKQLQNMTNQLDILSRVNARNTTIKKPIHSAAPAKDAKASVKHAGIRKLSR